MIAGHHKYLLCDPSNVVLVFASEAGGPKPLVHMSAPTAAAAAARRSSTSRPALLHNTIQSCQTPHYGQHGLLSMWPRRSLYSNGL